MEPEDSLIMGIEELSTIPKKESDEFIRSSVEDLVPILSESEDTFESDSDCDSPSCNDFSSIDVPRGKFMTLSNPMICTDIANITRKEPKSDKNEHETERVHKSRKFSSKRSTKSQQWSNLGQPQNDKTLKISK
ncbi:hypothetical protein Tco_0464316 [Tanacetum coccineum]